MFRWSIQISLWMKQEGQNALTRTRRGCCKLFWWHLFALVLFIKERMHFIQQIDSGCLGDSENPSSRQVWIISVREKIRLIKRKGKARHQRDDSLRGREPYSTLSFMWFRAEIKTRVSSCILRAEIPFWETLMRWNWYCV